MLKVFIIISLVAFYLSLPGFFAKAGYETYKGLIPIYNIYILIQILRISPLMLMVVGLSLIFLPDRVFFATLVIIFLPFIMADAYYKKPIIGLLTFILPFIMYPLIAYYTGAYCYDEED